MPPAKCRRAPRTRPPAGPCCRTSPPPAAWMNNSVNPPVGPHRSKCKSIFSGKPPAMADPTPVLPEPTTEPAPYRPLSGLALASFAVAAIYALVVAIFGFLAIVWGYPVFLSPAALAFPVLAVLLAATARWQIRTSEGARSGLALATWGLRLGLFFGITHAAIFFGTLLAVWMQAQISLDKEFVAKIQEGNLDDAFQFTLPPDQRGSSAENIARFSAMENGKKGPLPRFKENEIVSIIKAGGPELRRESMVIQGLPDVCRVGYGGVSDD